MTLDRLKDRSFDAIGVLTKIHEAIASLEVLIDERTATAVPLVLGSLDMADSIYTLLVKRPERSWVATHALARSQIEYLMRAAFFARAASDEEVMRFRETGRMPNRDDRTIYLRRLATEAAQHMSWPEELLIETVSQHQRELSSAIHGGREVLGIYTQHDEWGNIDLPWDELGPHVNNVLVFALLALDVVASHSSNDAQSKLAALGPAYNAANEYFGKWAA